ncbi:hypothetical protein HK102_000651 [Quaeritorhiza haematococci]|nr:hypothetical protein HK102_000651 [Quaeritorhiza haematococci]
MAPTTSLPGTSAVFEEYQKEYSTLVSSIRDRLSTLTNGSGSADDDDDDGGDKKMIHSKAGRELEEADEIISQMEMELLSLPPSVRAQISPRVRGFKEEVKALKKELSKVNTKAISEREALLGPSAGSKNKKNPGGSHFIDMDDHLEANSMDQRARLLQGTDRLTKQNDKLMEAQRIAMETGEHIALGVVGLKE